MAKMTAMTWDSNEMLTAMTMMIAAMMMMMDNHDDDDAPGRNRIHACSLPHLRFSRSTGSRS
eukprot:10080099-Karenia_brevis.AAC.1